MTKYATTKEKNYYDKQVQNFHNRYIQRRSQELDQGGGQKNIITVKIVLKIFEVIAPPEQILPPPHIDNKRDYWGILLLMQCLFYLIYIYETVFTYKTCWPF